MIKPRVHSLKTWKNVYQDSLYCHKTFEWRKNDRNFRVGDVLVLQEFDPETQTYTGEMHTKRVDYIIHGGIFNIPNEYCIMGVSPFPQPVDSK